MVRARRRLSLLLRHVPSYIAGLRASHRNGMSSRLRKVGREEEALEVAREGLALLNGPFVLRHQGAAGFALIYLTVQCERLAERLGERGASERDLADSVTCLEKGAPAAREQPGDIGADWLQMLSFLKTRLAERRGEGGEAEVVIAGIRRT